MTPGNGDNIPLPNTARLQKEQEYITAALGFVIHPTIRQSLFSSSTASRKIRIAVVSDIALPKDPESSLDSAWLEIPPHEISSLSGLDPELVDSFDVVAVNLLQTFIEHDKWEATIQNFKDLLKPGGWLQWVDWDPITARIAGAKPGTPDASNLRDLLRSYTDALQTRKVGSTYRISNKLKSQDFVENDSDLYPVPPDVGFTRVVTDGILNYLERTGQMSVEQAKVDSAKIEDEIQVSGPLVWYDLWCHIAQTPSQS